MRWIGDGGGGSASQRQSAHVCDDHVAQAIGSSLLSSAGWLVGWLVAI